MMPADAVFRAAVTGGCLHGCVLAATGHAAGQVTGRSAGRGTGIATLISWLLAESLGAFMLRTWLASGGASRRGPANQETMPVALIAGHAGLALAGLVSWIGFLISQLPALAWLSVGLLGPAIGLGISTVTIWTPYPVSRRRSGRPARHEQAGRQAGPPAILITNEMLDRVLADEALTSDLVDDLVERMLTEPPPERRASRWQLAPVIPILHGVLALATFLLAVLAAVRAAV
jgi:hypothetical protein